MFLVPNVLLLYKKALKALKIIPNPKKEPKNNKVPNYQLLVLSFIVYKPKKTIKYQIMFVPKLKRKRNLHGI